MLNPSLQSTVFPFAADVPLIPLAAITAPLDQAETIATQLMADSMAQAAEGLTRQALTGGNIAELRSPLSGDLQRSLNQHWLTGLSLGSSHGRAEMVAAIPLELRQQANAQTFAVDFATLGLIAALLSADLGAIAVPLAVQRAIDLRVAAIAGNFAKDFLNTLRSHLLAATVGEATGVISRSELESRIQNSLKVNRVRAEIIARNELTAAYNRGRVSAFRESALVTHARFLAINDRRTTDICRSRNGMLIPMADLGAIAVNTPPLHHRCRSLLSPVMPSVNEDHQSWVEDESRRWDARELAPLTDGWFS